jgi:hypothetical protein
MKSSRKHLIPLILAAILLSIEGTSLAQAQDVISAGVDRSTLSTDETLLLTVTINGSALNTPAPVLPALAGFSLLGSSSSSQISIINGDISSQAIYHYRLQPYDTGDLIIEPIGVTLNGQTFYTAPITVHVTQGTGTPAAGQPRPQQSITSSELTGQDFFVEAEIDNPTPYVGQQVVYTFRFYQATNLWEQPEYNAPPFTGFWNEEISEQQEYQAQAAGRIYRVIELHTILFPSLAGPVTIEPAQLTIPGGVFSSGQTLQTKPVSLDVRPLPPGAPAGFDGAVGQFSLEAAVDATQGRVNEPLTWRVTLSGQGNLTAAPDPAWPEMPGWRDFESEATIHTEVRDGQAVGSRVYERLLVPGTAGEFTIPSLEYYYFDPAAKRYEIARSEPVPVVIGPGAAEEPTITAKDSQEEDSSQEQAQAMADIHHLKPVPSDLHKTGRPATESGLYWATWILPALGAVGYLAWQRRQRYWEKNAGLVRSSRARKKARQALARARKREDGAYTAAGQILTTYLSDKLDRPVAGLTHQALVGLLTGQGLGPDLVERIQVCLASSELGRFAPEAGAPGHASSLLKEVEILIDTLEQAL